MSRSKLVEHMDAAEGIKSVKKKRKQKCFAKKAAAKPSADGSEEIASPPPVWASDDTSADEDSASAAHGQVASERTTEEQDDGTDDSPVAQEYCPIMEYCPIIAGMCPWYRAAFWYSTILFTVGFCHLCGQRIPIQVVPGVPNATYASPMCRFLDVQSAGYDDNHLFGFFLLISTCFVHSMMLRFIATPEGKERILKEAYANPILETMKLLSPDPIVAINRDLRFTFGASQDAQRRSQFIGLAAI
ncbi:unnamed protein product, partial [Symbiodinium necroappetens]